MKLAIVYDAPRDTRGGVSGTYTQRVLDACVAFDGTSVETRDFFAVEETQPGGKTPPIAVLRAGSARLVAEIAAWQPDMVLSMGAGALNGLNRGPKAVTISKERGRMRWLYPDGLRFPWLPTIDPRSVVRAPDLHRDFVTDVYKAITQAEPMSRMPVDLTVASTVGELERALGDLDGATVVAVDVETSGLDVYSESLFAVGIGGTYSHSTVPGGVGGIAVIAPQELLVHGDPGGAIWDAVWRQSRRTVGHNFKFDMQFLAPLIGWPPPEARLGDTMLLAYLLDERPNRPDSRVRGHGLKDAVAVRYDYQYGFDFGEFYKIAEEERDYREMHVYLGDDVAYTARYWHDLEAEALTESPRLLACHDDLLMPVSRTIARCEFDGAPLDLTWIKSTIRTFRRREDRRKLALETQIKRLTERELDNVLSPSQVADVMYDDWHMTPDVRKHGVIPMGDRSTDKDHVRAAVAKYLGNEQLDRPARWLRSLERLRHDVRTRTTYEKSLLGRATADGRVRANFLLHGTSTGRLSSRDPNLQNVPAMDRVDSDRSLPMRRAFRPANGWLWVEVDYSQLELRVAAGLSGDLAFREVFASGRDVHLEVASDIFGKEPEDVSKAERFLAKAIGFGIIYGRGEKALATGTEMRYAEQELGMKAWTVEQAGLFIKKFLRSYPALGAWIERLHDEVPRQGYVETSFGRRRRFPLIPRSRGELGSIQRQAVNTPVQSAASDICLTAMVEIARQIETQNVQARVLFPVHDSICLECAPEDIERLRTVCLAAMERDFEGVPLTVDFEYGPTWADVKGA